MLIDTHCHLESFARRGDVPAVLDSAADADIGRVISIGTCPSDWSEYARLAAAYPGRVDYSVGLHPCDVGDDDQAWQTAVSLLPAFFQTPPVSPPLETQNSILDPSHPPAEGGTLSRHSPAEALAKAGAPDSSLSPPPRPVALGEIGLDRYHLPKDPALAAAAFARQEAAFRAQLALAASLTCPIIIHSRQAFPDCLRVIDESGLPWSRFVFHCFSDGPDEARTLVARGGRASFTGIITYKNADSVRAALLAQGLDRLLLETDAPYLAPTPHRGHPNEPAYLAHTAREAARILNLPLAELTARTTATAREFFDLST